MARFDPFGGAPRTRGIAGRASLCLIALCGLLVHPAAAESAPPDLSALIAQLDKTTLDLPGATVVENLEFAAGPARFRLAKGLLVPATALGAGPGEVVFVGNGHMYFDPADEIESQQLELFSGAKILDIDLSDAVFLGPPAELLSALNGPRSSPANAAQLEQARRTFDQWVGSAERRHFGVTSSLLQRASGDQHMAGYFAAWVRRAGQKPFVYTLDPEREEQLEVWQFTPLAITADQKFKVEARLGRDLREGRFRGFELGMVGDLDMWVKQVLRTPEGTAAPGATGVEPKHYELELRIQPDGERVSGRARVTLEATASGVRSFFATLQSDLVVQTVADASGTPIPFRQDGARIVALLAAPLAASETTTIEIRYEGILFRREGDKISFHSMNSWRPSIGTRDRATYDVTIHWPKKFDVAACGRKVESAEEGDWRRERRTLDSPSSAFAFVVGDFETATKTQGHITLTAAFDASARHLEKEDREDIAQGVLDVIQFFEELYGRFPSDEITAVFADARGAVAPGFLVLDSSSKYSAALDVAEQWWGGLVRPATYRDKWLVIALRNYAADLYSLRVLKKTPPELRISALDNWCKAGRTAESVGPVVLGWRLDSSLCDCWSPVAVTKGNRVLQSLANLVGEEPFDALLREGLRTWRGKSLATAQFMSFVQKKHGRSLDWFAKRYVYGVGLVDVHYTYQIDPGPKGWTLKIVVEQSPHRTYRVGLARRPDGALDVEHRSVGGSDVKDSILVIPTKIPLKPLPGETKTSENQQGSRALTGQVVASGPRKEHTFTFAYEPESVELDPQRAVLAYFHCETCQPKQVLRDRAYGRLYEGDLEGAEVLFNRSLSSPVTADPPPQRSDARLVWNRWVSTHDALTYLGLARVSMERGEFDEAWARYEQARKSHAQEWTDANIEAFAVFEAQLRLRQNDFDGAWKVLWKRILDGQPHAVDSWLLLGIAAKSRGEAAALQKALTHVEQIGLDSALLKEKTPNSD